MKLGLKLWSTNTDFYYNEAKKLYTQGYFDYIELYVVPNSINTIEKWKQINIPLTLHAPHFMHKVNLADKEQERYNFFVFDQVKTFAEALNAQYIVIHGGIEGNLQETIRQLNLIQKKFNSTLLIENKPPYTPLGEQLPCRGAIYEEITEIMDATNLNFCLDIGHAICTANFLGIEPYSYVFLFNTLSPICYHFSDNFISDTTDKHLHFKEGTINFSKILSIISPDKNIAIETKKNSKINLNDFVNDCNYLRGLLCK